jgi:hypothetical protein
MADDPVIHKAPGGLEFIINEDGSVTFVKLPPEMIDVARALDPDAVLACDIVNPDAGSDSDDSDT